MVIMLQVGKRYDNNNNSREDGRIMEGSSEYQLGSRGQLLSNEEIRTMEMRQWRLLIASGRRDGVGVYKLNSVD